ncbi:MAG TPA: hypothetical protein VKF79_10220 [Candidatus Acidoferrum sp.]|nr:hypothetical protein [Candidatus Acidoferrum sp.]
MSVYPIQPITLGAIRTYPLASRKSKVSVRDFAKPLGANSSMSKFLDSLPAILAGNDLRGVAAAIHEARHRGKAILWGLGGHVVKVGLGPVLSDLMRRGFVSGIAINGAALVHDFEIALSGGTSEDVDASLKTGDFGMATETGLFLNQIAVSASFHATGYGEAAGKFLADRKLEPENAKASILLQAYKRKIPVTVHLAIGTDIPHMHPMADGAALGLSTHHDFRLFCAMVAAMDGGGAYLNWGSAVMLPEIFLKAVAVVRNQKIPLAHIATANFDFVQHYRPLQNVVKRPVAPLKGKGATASRGWAITGHHELLMPLLAAALSAGWPQKAGRTK